MSGDSSEEKSLPPSEKKLRDARKKGQIAKASDLVAAVALLATLGYVWAGAGWIEERLREPLLLAAEAGTTGFDEAWRRLVPGLLLACGSVAAPVLMLSLAASVGASVITNGGFLFVLDPLIPKMERLDPVKGFGRLFGMRSWIELAKSVVKAALFGGSLGWLAWGALDPVAHAANCGATCLPRLLGAVLKPLLGAALGITLASGVADMLLQRWLFLREMRMTPTEAKRERKDQNGSPEIKGEQRRLRLEAAGGERLGLGRASLVVGGLGAAVGLRYVRGETDVPFVVCRARGEPASALVAAARERGVPVFWDETLAQALVDQFRLGAKILRRELFQQVAQALYASGAIRS